MLYKNLFIANWLTKYSCHCYMAVDHELNICFELEIKKHRNLQLLQNQLFKMEWFKNFYIINIRLEEYKSKNQYWLTWITQLLLPGWKWILYQNFVVLLRGARSRSTKQNLKKKEYLIDKLNYGTCISQVSLKRTLNQCQKQRSVSNPQVKAKNI